MENDQQTQSAVNSQQTTAENKTPNSVHGSQSTKSNNFLTTLLSVLLLISISAAGYFVYQVQNLRKELSDLSMVNVESTPTAISTNPTSQPTLSSVSSTVGSKPGWRMYQDKDVGFTVEFPEQLSPYLYRDEFNQYIQKREKVIFFCETPIDQKSGQGYFKCTSGGIMVWANGDGWGGGCDMEYHDSKEVAGEEKDFCIYDTGFGQLYLNIATDENRFLIEGKFSNTFTNNMAWGILKSFEIVN